MLKSDRENKESEYLYFSVGSILLRVVIPSLFMEEDDDPLFMDNW